MPPFLPLLLSAALLTLSVTAEEKTNVIFILADDLGWGEVGAFGQKKIPTPNLDALAASGTRFTQHYSGAPVCAPSRCVLMTGKHLGHAEVRGNRAMEKVDPAKYTEGQHPLSEKAFTLAMAFKQAGYHTAAIGKWGLGPVGSTGDPNLKGFDLFFGYNCQAVAHSYYPPYLWRNNEKIILNQNPIPGHAKPVTGDVKLEDWIGQTYAPTLMINEAESFIEVQKTNPFFLYLAFIEPHVSMHPPKASVDKFPADWDTEPYRGQSGYIPHPRPHAGYAAMISDLDSYVGRVIAKLEQQGLTDRTLIIFSSDNGTTHPGPATTHFHIGGADPAFFNSTAGLRGYKGSVYEGGLRVPTIAKLPGKIPANTTNNSPGYFADWFPTLCDATGIPKPENLDGESLWPTLTTGTPLKDRSQPMLWVFPEYGGQVAVRIGPMKLVRQNLKTKNKTPGPWEVYNLETDPAEATDLAATHPDLIKQAEAILLREVAPNPTFPLPIPNIPQSQN
jgi:arylsulfatase A-like enzyme